MIPKYTGDKRINKWNLIKIKNFLCLKRHYQESEKSTHSMEKYFQIIPLVRDWYTKYIKNSYNSIIKIQPN